MAIEKWNDIRTDFTNGFILGNGASIAVDQRFKYAGLLEAARDSGCMTDQLNELFKRSATSDFERVMRELADTDGINSIMQVADPDKRISKAYTEIKQSLVTTVKAHHCGYDDVTNNLKAIYEFLCPFERVVSLNYDLILYWAILKGNDALGTWFKDCFDKGRFRGDWKELCKPYKGAEGATLVFYPHGNLMLARSRDGAEHKLTVGENNNLLDTITTHWDNGVTPLFVSEGSTMQKLLAIRRSPYLSIVYDEVLPTIGKNIAVYGWSFSDNDEHLLKAILREPKINLAVSIHVDGRDNYMVEDDRRRIESAVKRVNQTATVVFYDSASPGCWINPPGMP